MDFMLSYYDAVEAGPAVVGGKGWNLGRLARYGFPVPLGGVLIADAYAECMSLPALQALRAKLSTFEATEAESQAVLHALAAIRSIITDAEFPVEMVNQIQTFLTNSKLGSVPVAVRSSATMEDSYAASFAGIHQSFLNVFGFQQVLQAIKECYASLWTPQAFAYRRHLGLDDSAVKCAVVICAMVTQRNGDPPLAAGVAFSCDPQTGQRDRMSISAAPEFSEAITSGSTNPEEIQVILGKGQPALVVSTRGNSRHHPVLGESQVLELAHVIERIQWALGDGQDPQDVEWAHDGQQFWLLQARPITHLPRLTFREVSHVPVIWSNANVKDTIPLVLSTLSWSSLYDGFHTFLYAGRRSVWPGGMEMIRRFYGRPYLDVTSLMWYAYDTFGITPQHMSQVLGGHQPAIPIPPGNPLRGLQGLRRIFARLKMLIEAMKSSRPFWREIERTFARARRFKAIELQHLSKAELLELSTRVIGQAGIFVRRTMANNMVIWEQILVKLLDHFNPGRGQTLAATLMTGSGKVVSAELGYRIFDLAAAAEGDSQARAYIETQPCDPQGWQHLPQDSPFRLAFANFLDSYGHRGVYEIDMENPRWNENPGYLLEQVRFFLSQGWTRVPGKHTNMTGQAEQTEANPLPLFIRPIVHWLIYRSRQAAAMREAGKSAFVALVEPSRYIALEIGRRMMAAGILEHTIDVFQLAKVEIEAYLRGTWEGEGARALVTDRKAQRDTWLAETPPDIFITDAQGRPFQLSEDSASILVQGSIDRSATPLANQQPYNGSILFGVGASAGRASGRACIVRHPSDGSRLRSGDILVAPSTDPGWTPLFLRASAVVMQVGGYLSHGAIVAREYGIPAVVNVPKLLGSVREGQQLTVDGDSGQILLGD